MKVAPTPTPMSPTQASDGSAREGPAGRSVRAASQYTQAVADMMIATVTVRRAGLTGRGGDRLAAFARHPCARTTQTA